MEINGVPQSVQTTPALHLRCSALQRSTEWWFLYRRFGTTCLSHVQGSGSPLTLDEESDRLSLNAVDKLPVYAA